MQGKLYVVGTPIGNLTDISSRGTEALKNVDLLLCEDTRVTKKLLTALNIRAATESYHQYSGENKLKSVAKSLREGKNLALVTDAGMPGVSDPGGKLLDYLYKNLFDFKPISVPGPSAVTAALSICGFAADKYIFFGFPPNKRKRQKYFEKINKADLTVVFFESCHRIRKTLKQLAENLPAERRICVCRELTKKFEQIYRGEISAVEKIEMKEKGEFVVVIEA